MTSRDGKLAVAAVAPVVASAVIVGIHRFRDRRRRRTDLDYAWSKVEPVWKRAQAIAGHPSSG